MERLSLDPAAPPSTIGAPHDRPSLRRTVRDTLVAALVAGTTLGLGWGALAWLVVEQFRLIGGAVAFLGPG